MWPLGIADLNGVLNSLEDPGQQRRKIIVEAAGSPGRPVLAVYKTPQADLERCPEGNRLQD